MVFSSVIFLFLFLPVSLVLYYVTKPALRNYVLLAISLVFYAWGETQYIVIMFISITANYCFGLLIDGRSDISKRKLCLAVSVAFNLSMLIFFKYSGFIVENFAGLFNISIKAPSVRLPLGISFFTFHCISYLVDVYKGNVKVQKNYWDLALYICLFPQLVAGPIIRYHSICDQLQERTCTLLKFGEGVNIFLIGLFKKVLIANELGKLADSAFMSNELSVVSAWLGILAYTLQIYFDFSGYSDMAVGLGKMFGFDFPENFNFPYIAKSAGEFWRRWHISLGTWFRDYVYIPLGGSRTGTARTYLNLFIVWFLTGFWHGASWTFICWGLYFGLLISLEKAFLLKLQAKIWSGFSHIYLVLAVMIGWVFFRADSFTYSLSFIKNMLGLSGNPLIDNRALAYLKDYGLMVLIGILFSMPIVDYIKEKLSKVSLRPVMTHAIYLTQSISYAVLFVLCVIALIASTYNPFLYFRF